MSSSSTSSSPSAVPNAYNATVISTDFYFPLGVVYNPVDGLLYACDSSTNLVTKLSTTGVTLATFDFGLSTPWSMAVDSAGSLFVSDSDHNCIVKFTSNGTQLQVFTARGTLHNPLTIYVDSNDTLWVCDYQSRRVVQLSSTDTVLLSLNLPWMASVVVDSAGTAYLADFVNYRITKRTAVGNSSIIYTGLRTAYNMALDGLGSLFVSDSNNNRIVQLTTSGAFVQNITLPAGPWYAPFPTGLTMGRGAEWFAADYANRRVVRFDAVSAAVAAS